MTDAAVWAPLLISSACTACGLCLATCPEGALRPAPGRPGLIAARCTLCLACVEVCPVDAITTGERVASTIELATCWRELMPTTPNLRPTGAAPLPRP